MALAGMIAVDENALICDFAETYHIYDYKSLPPVTAATLAAGLRDDSRIIMEINKQPVKQEDLLLAALLDQIRILMWDGKSERPESVVQVMYEGGKKPEKEVQTFASLEEFNIARNKILGGG